MPAPQSYSDASLAQFMVAELGGIAGVLSWTVGSGAVAEAASDTAVILGVAVADATNMATLRAVARLAIWRMAEGALSVAYDETTEGQSLKRSQMWDHAKAMVTRYEGQCAALGVDVGTGGGVVTIHPVTRSEDPYGIPAASGAEF